jgi:plasmid replication initiation protein
MPQNVSGYCYYVNIERKTKYGNKKESLLERRTKMFKVIIKEKDGGFVHETMFVGFNEAEAIERAYARDDFYSVSISRVRN